MKKGVALGDQVKTHSYTCRSISPKGINPGVSRRDFLRLGAAASLGLATGSIWRPGVLRASGNDTSRVVIVTDDLVATGSIIDPSIVRIMIDAGIMALTDAATAEEGWLNLFPDLSPEANVGIKINTINRYLSSHPEVAEALAESLASTPVGSGNYPINQIMIWDRHDGELINAGYTINTSTSGVRCVGTDHAGYGYNSNYLNINGSLQQVSRCYSDHSDFLINLSVMKNHNIAGATFSLKNHYGTIHNPGFMHPGYCDPYIPALNSALIQEYGSRQKLCICDAIFGSYYGGPTGLPQFAHKAIILSQDPVALDVVCRGILEDYGCATLYMATHIDTAGQPPYNLGISDPANIEIVEVVNPSQGVSPGRNQQQPLGISLGQNYPEPFNSATSIPISLDRPGEILLDVFNVRGQRIQRLYQGSLSAGKHTFSWQGVDSRGRPAGSGRYTVRLQTGGKTHNRIMTLLR